METNSNGAQALQACTEEVTELVKVCPVKNGAARRGMIHTAKRGVGISSVNWIRAEHEIYNGALSCKISAPTR